MSPALAAAKTRYGITILNKPRKDCNLWGLRLARLANYQSFSNL